MLSDPEANPLDNEVEEPSQDEEDKLSGVDQSSEGGFESPDGSLIVDITSNAGSKLAKKLEFEVSQPYSGAET